MKRFLFLVLVFVAILNIDGFSQDNRTNPWTRNSSFAFNMGNVSDTSSVPLFKTSFEFRVDSIRAVVTGETPQIDFNIQFGTSISTGTDLFVSEESVTSISTGDLFTSFDTPLISANDWLVLKIIAMSGTVYNFSVTVYFTRMD